jgi:hypothetical protein
MLIISRHCAPEDIYDDFGYCDTKIKKYDPYYIVELPNSDGQCETLCESCMLNMLLSTKDPRSYLFNEDFEFTDLWFKESMNMRSTLYDNKYTNETTQ